MTQTLDTLRSALGWIEHWKVDVQCGCLPTEESLQRAADELRAVIRQSDPVQMHPLVEAAIGPQLKKFFGSKQP